MILVLEKKSNETLHKQICRQIREAILNGTLPGGYKMPSTRQMEADYSVSRNVFLGAFEQLQAEGYLSSERGRGTFVSHGIHELEYQKTQEQSRPQSSSDPVLYNFSIGNPDPSYFPLNDWGRALKKAVSELKSSEMGYNNNSGSIKLKKELQKHLFRQKGMHVHEDQIFICSGSFQAILLAMKTIMNPGHYAIVENPSYKAITQAMAQAGTRIYPVPYDEEGMICTAIPQDVEISMVSTLPAHSYPSGNVLSIKRRLELCRMAEQRDFYILENDFEGDHRLKGSPIPALHTLNEKRVLHSGTFSQILFPAERIGYLIAPEHLIEKTMHSYHDMGYGVSVSVQNALAQMMVDGIILKQYRKMIKLYQSRQKVLIDALKKYFNEDLKISGIDTGSYITVSFPGIQFNSQIASQIRKQGLLCDFEFKHIYPFSERHEAPGILLGFGHMENQQIQKGVAFLSQLLNRPADARK